MGRVNIGGGPFESVFLTEWGEGSFKRSCVYIRIRVYVYTHVCLFDRRIFSPLSLYR